MKYTRVSPLIVLCLFILVGATGCDTLEGINPFNNEKEVQGVIENMTDNSLTVEGIEYAVTANTKFDGIDGMQDLSVGTEVEIEYEEQSGAREAKEVELPD